MSSFACEKAGPTSPAFLLFALFEGLRISRRDSVTLVAALSVSSSPQPPRSQ